MKVGILGAGAYGSAMAGVLRENKNTVKFYDPYRFPNILLLQIVKWAEVLVMAVPAEAVSALLKSMPVAAFKKPLIVLTKGMMDPSVWGKFAYFEIVSGPGFAEEIEKKRKIQLTVAARGALEGETLSEDLFSNKCVKFDKTEDVMGVAQLSGLKNIFAIEAGRRGLAFGSQDFKNYIAEVARECEKFLLENGGFVETVRLSAGLGDLVLTCGSEMSRNYQFGQLLGGRRRVLERKRLVKKFLRETTVEGIFASKVIEKNDFNIPKEAEILKDILRRVKNVTKR